MTTSNQPAGPIGPTAVGIGVTEAINTDVFALQTAPAIYLYGATLFVVGLTIVCSNNLWTWSWSMKLTLIGWAALIGGLCRMAMPEAPQAPDQVMTYSALNTTGGGDPEMSSTKKGNDRYLGMKAHIGVDADSGVTHSFETSTARLHESQVRDDLLHSK